MSWNFSGLDVTLWFSPSTLPTDTIPVWVSLSNRLRGMSWSAGRSMELDAFQAGTSTVILDNRDGQLSPAASTLWPGQLRAMCLMQARVTYAGVTTILWTTYVDEWPQSFDIGRTDATVTIHGTDLTKSLSLMPMPPSVWDRWMTSGAPFIGPAWGWWKLGETSGTVARDASGNNRHAVYRGGATFASVAGITPGSGSDAAIRFDPGVALVCPPITAYSSATVAAWIAPQAMSDGTTLPVFELAGNSSAYTVSVLAGLYTDTIGTRVFVEARGYGGAHLQTKYSDYLAPAAEPWVFAVSHTNSGAIKVQTGRDPYSGAATTLVSFSPSVPVTFSSVVVTVGDAILNSSNGTRAASATIDEVLVFTPAGNDFAVGNLTTNATRQSEVSSSRVTFIDDWLLPASVVASIHSASCTAVLEQSSSYGGKTALEALRSIEAAERGELFIDASGQVVFRGNLWRLLAQSGTAPAWSDVAGGGRLSFADVVVTEASDRHVYNLVRGVWNGQTVFEQGDAASQARYFTRVREIAVGPQSVDSPLAPPSNASMIADQPTRVSVASYDAAVYAVGRELARYREPTTRVETITSNIRLNPALVSSNIYLGRNCTVALTPPSGVPIAFAGHIEGWVHTITREGEWTATYTLSPSEAGIEAAAGYFAIGGSTIGGTAQIHY